VIAYVITIDPLRDDAVAVLKSLDKSITTYLATGADQKPSEAYERF